MLQKPSSADAIVNRDRIVDFIMGMVVRKIFFDM
jgi:hypothetical protein